MTREQPRSPDRSTVRRSQRCANAAIAAIDWQGGRSACSIPALARHYWANLHTLAPKVLTHVTPRSLLQHDQRLQSVARFQL